MPHFSAITLVLPVPLAIPAAAMAGPLAYSNPGHVAPASIIAATATGMIEGSFVSSLAVRDGSVRVLDATSNTDSSWLLDTRTSALGDTAAFSKVMVSDLLVSASGRAACLGPWL